MRHVPFAALTARPSPYPHTLVLSHHHIASPPHAGLTAAGDACVSAAGTTEWVEEHNPPPDTSCKVVSDPRFKSFKEYKYSFAGEVRARRAQSPPLTRRSAAMPCLVA